MKPIIFIFCLLCGSQNLFAQSLSVKTSVDTNQILIGQRIKFRVETSMPDNTYRLSWISVPDSFGNFVTIAKNKIDSVYRNGNWNFSQDILLTSFDSGRQVIPQLSLAASTLDDDSSFTLYTDSIPIDVTYSPADSILPFHGIKDILTVKNEWPLWAYALIVVGAILLILLFWYLFKRSGKKKKEIIFESKLSPYEEAMQSLSDLEKEDLLQKNKIKEFHLKLSDILKRYLSRKANVNQMYLTTGELLIKLKEFNLPIDQVSAFANALQMGNVVKFAQYVPPAFESEKCFSQTKEIISGINNLENQKSEDGI